jgi:predicted AlkP superfamily pyrophosphatase or phosphodiesterase
MMSTNRKLICVLIDGLSADYFECHRARLPHLSAMAREGTMVRRLRSAVPGTSHPGRATMLTGVGAEVHGVYGNHILDGGAFRVSAPSDLRAPTIAGEAHRQGLDVACLGHAIVPSEDTATCVSPWWMRGFLRESRFAKNVPEAHLRQARFVKDPDDRLARAAVTEFEGYTLATQTNMPGFLEGSLWDYAMMRAAAALACSDAPPDLILTEVSMTDVLQHEFGYESDAAHWSIAMADLSVGMLLEQLRRAGRDRDYVLVVASDHGHSPIETAIFPQAIIPETTWISEGATLYVATRDEAERYRVAQALEPFGVRPWTNDHIPADVKERIATFVAPARHDFEGHHGAGPLSALGKPKYLSSHGICPGAPEDDRMLVAHGPGIPTRIIDAAEANQFTPSLAAILGLPVSRYPMMPLLA